MNPNADPVAILSAITVFNKYAKFNAETGTRETWDEIVDRNMEMHLRKYPELEDQTREAYLQVRTKKALPSMRSCQFGGLPIEINPTRIFNCAYRPATDPTFFDQLMFLLLSGSGCGYSVQRRHVSGLPVVIGPAKKSYRYLVGDSIEGWAEAIRSLFEAYFYGSMLPRFDFRSVRSKGALLSTSGGKAPGPAPLIRCIERLRSILDGRIGQKLEPIDVHDLACHIADAVLAGGIRRAAMICLFDADDGAMMDAKSGEWWTNSPQRGRANNSVVLVRGGVTETQFKEIWKRVEASGAGEPGVYWTNDLDWGTNPCCEIALRPFQFCNLTEVNVSDVTEQAELEARVKAASFIGTLQASYTDFHYLDRRWQAATEADALIGVGLTGIGSGAVLPLDLKAAAKAAVEENRRVAKLIGISPASRVTTVKPAGTSSLVLGSSSGIHAWHNDYYIRRQQMSKAEPLYKYLKANLPDIVKDLLSDPDNQAVAEFPQKAPDGAILRSESAMELLERVKRFNLEWVREGHILGENSNNVSCTVSVKPDEWADVGAWMWENRNDYNGIAVLPYFGGTYPQLPFEDITAEEYEKRLASLVAIDLTQVKETDDLTDRSAELACSGGACDVSL